MSGTKPSTNFGRAVVSSLAAFVGMVVLSATLAAVTDLDLTDRTQAWVTAYVIYWPLYTAIFLGWGARVYSRLDPPALSQLAIREDRDERRWRRRVFGLTGTTSTTISAAIVAVIVTILIAQQPEFRRDGAYIALALLTVASSWALTVFSFAQRYLRLAVDSPAGTHLRFHFPEVPRFSDYLTLAVLLSTMAAAVSTKIESRAAWRLVRTNVLVAFVFNSVILALMVSLLFGGLAV